MTDRHSSTIRDAARLARDDHPDDRPTRSELRTEDTDAGLERTIARCVCGNPLARKDGWTHTTCRGCSS